MSLQKSLGGRQWECSSRTAPIGNARSQGRPALAGGNKGLGREAARRLAEHGHRVIIGARDPERGGAAAADLGVEFVCLDVTSDDSVAAAAREVRERFGGLDVLVNNAGISGGMVGPADVDGAAVAVVLNTNTVGVVRMMHAFLPLLRESSQPVVVNVSSGLGSFAARADENRPEHRVPSPAYSASKAAVNMLTTIYAEALPELRINAVEPGPSATDLNGGRGSQSVTAGTDAVVAAATIGPDGPTGTLAPCASGCPARCARPAGTWSVARPNPDRPALAARPADRASLAASSQHLGYARPRPSPHG